MDDSPQLYQLVYDCFHVPQLFTFDPAGQIGLLLSLSLSRNMHISSMCVYFIHMYRRLEE